MQVASPASDSSHQLIAMQQAGPKQSQHGQAQKASPGAAMGALSLKAQVPKLDLGKVRRFCKCPWCLEWILHLGMTPAFLSWSPY